MLRQAVLYKVCHLKRNASNNSICNLTTDFSLTTQMVNVVVLRRLNVITRQNCSTPHLLPVINASCVPKFCYQLMHRRLGQYFPVGCALRNSSRTADDFDAKQCPRVNSRSAHEYTMLAPAELLLECREERSLYRGNSF
jgi:hypothetical protein